MLLVMLIIGVVILGTVAVTMFGDSPIVTRHKKLGGKRHNSGSGSDMSDDDHDSGWSDGGGD